MKKPEPEPWVELDFYKDELERFRTLLKLEKGKPGKALFYWGVGGIGKTTLLKKYREILEEEKVPYAYTNLQDLPQGETYLCALQSLALSLSEQQGKVIDEGFPRFTITLLPLLYRCGEGAEHPLLYGNKKWLELFALLPKLLNLPDPGSLWKQVLPWIPRPWHRLLRQLGGTEEVVLELMKLDLEEFPQRLLEAFVEDLSTLLPYRPGKEFKGVLLLDSLETLFGERDPQTVMAVQKPGEKLRHGYWVRELVQGALEAKVLPVLCSREQLSWEGGEEFLEYHLLGGMGERDAQRYLALRGIGAPPPVPPDPLQRILIELSDTLPGPEISCHPLSLSLCAEIVENYQRAHAGSLPEPALFLPTQEALKAQENLPQKEYQERVIEKLAKRFFESLEGEGKGEMIEWIRELALTPRFHEKVAFKLSNDRGHRISRALWKRLLGFSFVEEIPSLPGWFRFHKLLRFVLMRQLYSQQGVWEELHTLFQGYWEEEGEHALALYHHLLRTPEEASEGWYDRWSAARKEARGKDARALLRHWDEVDLDEQLRFFLGEVWKRLSFILAEALIFTPQAPSGPALERAIFLLTQLLNQVKEGGETWARTQRDLGIAYSDFPTGDRTENLKNAISCYENALKIHTQEAYPEEWALTQMNLGVAYSDLPTGDRTENLKKAISYYGYALHIYKEEVSLSTPVRS